MSEIELKLCPFCRKAAKVIDTHVYLSAAIRIGCSCCGVITPAVLIDHPANINGELDESTRYTRDQAIAKAAVVWNRRADDE